MKKLFIGIIKINIKYTFQNIYLIIYVNIRITNLFESLVGIVIIAK